MLNTKHIKTINDPQGNCISIAYYSSKKPLFNEWLFPTGMKRHMVSFLTSLVQNNITKRGNDKEYTIQSTRRKYKLLEISKPGCYSDILSNYQHHLWMFPVILTTTCQGWSVIFDPWSIASTFTMALSLIITVGHWFYDDSQGGVPHIKTSAPLLSRAEVLILLMTLHNL